MQIQNIRTRFEVIKCKFEAFKQDSTNPLQIQTIRMQIRSIRTKFEAIKCKFERDSHHSNANSKHSNEIQSNRIQIRTIRKGF